MENLLPWSRIKALVTLSLSWDLFYKSIDRHSPFTPPTSFIAPSGIPVSPCLVLHPCPFLVPPYPPCSLPSCSPAWCPDWQTSTIPLLGTMSTQSTNLAHYQCPPFRMSPPLNYGETHCPSSLHTCAVHCNSTPRNDDIFCPHPYIQVLLLAHRCHGPHSTASYNSITAHGRQIVILQRGNRFFIIGNCSTGHCKLGSTLLDAL